MKVFIAEVAMNFSSFVLSHQFKLFNLELQISIYDNCLEKFISVS